jgi:two-component system, chemotaxis family, protein-glutamate methylesterase/glutaminase
MKSTHAIVIGASAGGVSALLEVASGLPAGLDAAVGVVLHVGALPSILPQLLASRTELRVLHPADGQPLEAGTIYVAPPDHHMLFDEDAVRLSRGPRENHARPAIDPLFRTTALAWREKAIGVVLTGNLDDGTAGLAAIKACGGTAIVQDPATALEPSMPTSALDNVKVDHCLPLGQIAAKLAGLSGRAPAPALAATQVPVPERLRREQAVFEGRSPMENLDALGKVSALTCPDCGGGLWEIGDAKPLRYRCHTGHAFTARSLESAQVEQADHALWSSVRALQEREMLLRRLAAVAQATGDDRQADAGRRQADLVRAQAEMLGRLVEGNVNSA